VKILTKGAGPASDLNNPNPNKQVKKLKHRGDLTEDKGMMTFGGDEITNSDGTTTTVNGGG